MALFIFINYLGCGIEVGNPTEEDGSKKGVITISIADAPIDDAKSFYIFPEMIELLNRDGTITTLDFSINSKIDLLALQDGKKQNLGTSREIPPGIYVGVIMHLKENKHSVLVKEDNTNIEVPFVSEGKHEVFMQQEFTITKNKETNLLIHMDLRKSIVEQNGKIFFTPTVDILPEDQYGIIKGSIKNQKNATICAYLYDPYSGYIDPSSFEKLEPIPHETKDEYYPETYVDPLEKEGELPKPEEINSESEVVLEPGIDGLLEETPSKNEPEQEVKSEIDPTEGLDPLSKDYPQIDPIAYEEFVKDYHQAKKLPSFDNEQKIEKDISSECENAYASVHTKNGEFILRYLTQGQYTLRIFYDDNRFEDIEKSIEIGFGINAIINLDSN